MVRDRQLHRVWWFAASSRCSQSHKRIQSCHVWSGWVGKQYEGQKGQGYKGTWITLDTSWRITLGINSKHVHLQMLQESLLGSCFQLDPIGGWAAMVKEALKLLAVTHPHHACASCKCRGCVLQIKSHSESQLHHTIHHPCVTDVSRFVHPSHVLRTGNRWHCVKCGKICRQPMRGCGRWAVPVGKFRSWAMTLVFLAPSVFWEPLTRQNNLRVPKYQVCRRLQQDGKQECRGWVITCILYDDTQCVSPKGGMTSSISSPLRRSRWIQLVDVYGFTAWPYPTAYTFLYRALRPNSRFRGSMVPGFRFRSGFQSQQKTTHRLKSNRHC